MMLILLNMDHLILYYLIIILKLKQLVSKVYKILSIFLQSLHTLNHNDYDQNM